MRLHNLAVVGGLVVPIATIAPCRNVQAAALFTTSLSDWQSAAGTYLNTTSNYGSSSTALGDGAVSYNPGSIVTVGSTWNTWCCGYTGEAVWTGSGVTSTQLNFSGVYAFGLQIEPDIYQYESMTVTLSDGQTITATVGGEAGAQFFGFVGGGITSLTITDNAGDDFAFGNFYSVGSVCTVSSAGMAERVIPLGAAPCDVKINSASIIKNKVSITLSGSPEASGPLTLTANSDQSTFTTNAKGGANVGPGTYNVSFDRPKMPIGTYSSLKATWKVGSTSASSDFSLQNTWTVRGLVRHSTYNTPTETKCTGKNNDAWIVSQKCVFTKTKLMSDFITQTKINGTGNSSSYGLIKPANITIEPTLCKKVKKPSGFDQSKAFFQVPKVTGRCNTSLVGGKSIATNPDPYNASATDAKCGDNNLLVNTGGINFSVKSVQDLCPACVKDFNGTKGHIDNYVSDEACDAHHFIDQGNFFTIDTHGENK